MEDLIAALSICCTRIVEGECCTSSSLILSSSWLTFALSCTLSTHRLSVESVGRADSAIPTTNLSLFLPTQIHSACGNASSTAFEVKSRPMETVLSIFYLLCIWSLWLYEHLSDCSHDSSFLFCKRMVNVSLLCRDREAYFYALYHVILLVVYIVVYTV